MKLRVYLAGKIGKNDWRHPLVSGLRDHDWGDGPLDAGAFVYVGPFFVACDHGCFHGRNRQGMRNVRMNACPPGGYTQRRVIALNMTAIQRADLVLAYITAPDCYGTIFELGWAMCAGKRVVVAFAPWVTSSDFWFSAKQAAAVHTGVTSENLPDLLQKETLKTQTTLRLGGSGSFGKHKSKRYYK